MIAATVLVYLKYPTPGRVKTRLAAVVGAEAAARMYRDWLGIVLEQLQPARPFARIIGVFDGAHREAFQEWNHLVDDWGPQPSGDLGVRLADGFRIAHESGQPVLAVGTDCLELSANAIREALEVLQSEDAVFGPTSDGGYYLVGTRRHLPGFFDGIRWSCAETLNDHVANCRANGWSLALLEVKHDIDTWEDWLAYERRTAGNERN